MLTVKVKCQNVVGVWAPGEGWELDENMGLDKMNEVLDACDDRRLFWKCELFQLLHSLMKNVWHLWLRLSFKFPF